MVLYLMGGWDSLLVKIRGVVRMAGQAGAAAAERMISGITVTATF